MNFESSLQGQGHLLIVSEYLSDSIVTSNNNSLWAYHLRTAFVFTTKRIVISPDLEMVA